MERERGLRLRLEVQTVQVLHQEFRDVLEGELLPHVHDVVVEEDARRAPHDHLLRVELAEVGGGGLSHGPGRSLVAPLEVLDAAAVGRPSHGGEIDVQQLEHVHHGAHQMGRPQDVATQVEHDFRGLDVAFGRGQQPVPFLGG